MVYDSAEKPPRLSVSLYAFFRQIKTIGTPDTFVLVTVAIFCAGKTVKITFAVLDCMHQFNLALSRNFNANIPGNTADFLHIHLPVLLSNNHLSD